MSAQSERTEAKCKDKGGSVAEPLVKKTTDWWADQLAYKEANYNVSACV